MEYKLFGYKLTTRYAAPLLLLGAAWLMGCGGTVGISLGDSVSLPASPTTLSGGWVFIATATTGAVPFTQLVGSLDERSATTSGSNPLQALLQIQGPGSCYVGIDLLPLQGNLQSSGSSLYSFEVNNQYLTINAAPNSTNTQLTGTYNVGGGCANGVTGTITGTRYLPLNGTYTGTSMGGSPNTVTSLSLTQTPAANGDGSFAITGNALFQGPSCFTKGSITSGEALGNTLHLFLTTNEVTPSQVTIDGSFNTNATSVTLSSIKVTGGSCAGSLGSGTLTVPS